MQLIEKLCFYKIEQIFNPYPPAPFPMWKAVYALLDLHRAEPFGIHARHPCRGENTGTGVPAQARMLVVSHTKPLHDAVAQMADDLYGGFAPKQGCFGCLPKVLHDAKPTKQATFDTPFLNNQEVYLQTVRPPKGGRCCFIGEKTVKLCLQTKSAWKRACFMLK